MRINPFLLALFFCIACQPHKISLKNPPPVKTSELNVPINKKDSWDRLIKFVYKQGYIIKSRDEDSGKMVLKIEDAPITILNSSSLPDDKNAIAFTELIRKGSNPDRLYARKGNIDIDILMEEENNNTTSVLIKFGEKGLLTEYYQNGFTVRKPIKNINIWTTGVLEKMISEILNK